MSHIFRLLFSIWFGWRCRFFRSFTENKLLFESIMQSNVDDAGIGTGFNELPTRTQTRQIFCAEYDEIALRAKSIWAHDNQMPLAADDISINYLSMFFCCQKW